MPVLTSPANKTLPLRGVTAAAWPALTGKVVYESEAEFQLAVASRSPGKLGVRVVRSNASSLLGFEYRLIMTETDYDDAIRLTVSLPIFGLGLSFADFRLDGPGVLPPNYFESTPNEGFTFRFDYGVAVGRDTRWCFVATNAREFRETGGVVKLITDKISTRIESPAPIALAAERFMVHAAEDVPGVDEAMLLL